MTSKNSSAPGQMDLLEVGPENLKEIESHLDIYGWTVKRRIVLLATEVKEKQIILQLVQKAKLKPLANGHIKFRCRGMEIDLEPRDTVIHIKKIAIAAKNPGKSRPNQGKPTGKENKKRRRTAAGMAAQVTAEEAKGEK